MSEESKEKQERAPDGAVPRERIARYLMCNILGKQTDPDWTPDPMELRIVASAIDGYIRAERYVERAAQAAPSSTESSEYLRGFERGIEEAARRLAVWDGHLRAVGSVHACETLRQAVGALLTDNAQDTIEDPIGHAEREKAGFARIAVSAIDRLRALAGNADPKGTPPSPSREDLLGGRNE